MRVITFKLTEDVLEAVDRYAIRHGMSRSEVIRLALMKLIDTSAPSYGKLKVKKLVVK